VAFVAVSDEKLVVVFVDVATRLHRRVELVARTWALMRSNYTAFVAMKEQWERRLFEEPASELVSTLLNA
jgi:hypothetical protein